MKIETKAVLYGLFMMISVLVLCSILAKLFNIDVYLLLFGNVVGFLTMIWYWITQEDKE